MLTYLYPAYRKGIEVTSYQDDAVGIMTKNDRGVPWVSSVVLKPRIVYVRGTQPSREVETRLHHAAHEECFIANSVKTDITVAMATEWSRACAPASKLPIESEPIEAQNQVSNRCCSW